MSWVAPLVRKLAPQSRLVLDLHNVEHTVFERRVPYAPETEKAEIQERFERMRDWEYEVWPWYDACLTVSPEESRIFREHTGSRIPIFTLPTGGGINLDRFQDSTNQKREPHSLVTRPLALHSFCLGSRVLFLISIPRSAFRIPHSAIRNPQSLELPSLPQLGFRFGYDPVHFPATARGQWRFNVLSQQLPYPVSRHVFPFPRLVRLHRGAPGAGGEKRREDPGNHGTVQPFPARPGIGRRSRPAGSSPGSRSHRSRRNRASGHGDGQSPGRRGGPRHGVPAHAVQGNRPQPVQERA